MGGTRDIRYGGAMDIGTREPSVLYEDTEMIVLDKPAGLITHPDGRTIEPSVTSWLLLNYPALAGVGEPWRSPQGEIIDRPGIVHRLDRTTSGIMIVAKTPEAHALLKEAFQKRAVEKEYRAYVYGHPKENRGIIEAEIERVRSTPPRWGVVKGGGSSGRAAVTEWEVLARGTDKDSGEKATFLMARPKTGRTHQIRVHLQAIHHPVVHDHLYAKGRASILGFERPALHAHQLSLSVPLGERKTFIAPLPYDFEEAARRFMLL